MTDCRAFNREFVKSFPILSDEFETKMTIHALDKKMLIAEIPLEYKDLRTGSDSKLNTFSDGLQVLFTIFKLFKDYKPFTFFGIISLILFAVETTLFIPILIEFFKTGQVPRFPTLIGVIGIKVAAMLSFCCGLILDTVRKYVHQFFELNLTILASKSVSDGVKERDG